MNGLTNECTPFAATFASHVSFRYLKRTSYFLREGNWQADANRRDSLQHSEDCLADRCTDPAATGRRMSSDYWYQRFFWRCAEHDAHDRGCSSPPQRLYFPHWLGGRPHAHVTDWL